jgi:hypothetical protein
MIAGIFEKESNNRVNNNCFSHTIGIEAAVRVYLKSWYEGQHLRR